MQPSSAGPCISQRPSVIAASTACLACLIELGCTASPAGWQTLHRSIGFPTWLVAHWLSAARFSAQTFTYGPVHGPSCGFSPLIVQQPARCTRALGRAVTARDVDHV